MPKERNICCCGASSWTKAIAWIQIVSSIILTIAIVSLLGLMIRGIDQRHVSEKDSLIAILLAISLVIAIIGFIMAIILLKGANQRRVGYLRAWLIYAGVAIILLIISLIVHTVITTALGIAINIFYFAVVYIHMKEINEGVFMV